MWLQSIVGISVVFLALVALSFFIYLFGKFMKNGDDRAQKRMTEKLKKTEAGLEITAPVDDDDADELIAVITAAVRAAVSGSGIIPECAIKVKPFKRVSSQSPVWHEAGRKELVN